MFLFFKEGGLRNLFDFQDWPLWVSLLCLAAGLVSAQDKKIARETYFNLAFSLFFLFYIGKALFSEEKNKGWIALVICIFSSVVAGIGVAELHFGRNILYESFISNPFYGRYIGERPMSTQFNPAPLATYLLATLPFAIYTYRQNNLKTRAVGCTTIIINTTCLLLTFCRSSFLGLIAMFLFYIWVEKKYKMLIFALIIFIILLNVISFLPYPMNRYSLKGIGFYGTGIFSEYRINRTVMVLKMLKDHPFFGVGLNHFRLLFDNYYPVKNAIQYIPYEIKIADNMFLTLLAEAGLLGSVGFFIFVSSLFKRGFRRLRNVQNKKQMLVITMSVLLGILVNMGGYELFYWYNPYMLFCLFCGFLGSGGGGIKPTGDARDEES